MEENINKFNKPPVYGQWIDVKERKPEVDKLVIFIEDEWVCAGYLSEDGQWYNQFESAGDPPVCCTHWIPLPPFPGSVDVEEKKECQHEALTDTGVGYHHCPIFKVDGLVDSSVSEKEELDELLTYKHVCNESIAHLDREVSRLTEVIKTAMIRNPNSQTYKILKQGLEKGGESLDKLKLKPLPTPKESVKEVSKAEIERLKQENERLKEISYVSGDLIVAIHEYLGSISGRDIVYSKEAYKKVDDLSNSYYDKMKAAIESRILGKEEKLKKLSENE